MRKIYRKHLLVVTILRQPVPVEEPLCPVAGYGGPAEPDHSPVQPTQEGQPPTTSQASRYFYSTIFDPKDV